MMERNVMKRLILLVIVLFSVGAACSSTPEKKDEEVAPQGGTVNEEAINAFEDAVTAYQKEPRDLGLVESKLEDAVDEDPNFGKAWFNLGLVREMQSDNDGAKQAYEKAIETAPALGGPHVNLGMMKFDETESVEEAEPYFQRAVDAGGGGAP
jgi:Tfp pilus assembly protein PilF